MIVVPGAEMGPVRNGTSRAVPCVLVLDADDEFMDRYRAAIRDAS